MAHHKKVIHYITIDFFMSFKFWHPNNKLVKCKQFRILCSVTFVVELAIQQQNCCYLWQQAKQYAKKQKPPGKDGVQNTASFMHGKVMSD